MIQLMVSERRNNELSLLFHTDASSLTYQTIFQGISEDLHPHSSPAAETN